MLKSFSLAAQIIDNQFNEKRQFSSEAYSAGLQVCVLRSTGACPFSPHRNGNCLSGCPDIKFSTFQCNDLGIFSLSFKTRTLNLLITAASLWIQSVCSPNPLHPISVLYFKCWDNWMNLKREVHQALYLAPLGLLSVLSDSVIMEKVRLQGPGVSYLLNCLISWAA